MILTKMKKCFLMLLIGLLSVDLLNCKPVDPPGPTTDTLPTSITVYAADKDISRMEVGDTFEVAVDVEPSDACWDVNYSIEPSDVARIDENGIVTAVKGGTFRIKATSVLDDTIFAYYKNTITVIDHTESYQRIDDAIRYLEELYPDNTKVEGWIQYIDSIDAFPDVTLTWSSSNSSVYPINNLYKRGTQDVTVEINCIVGCEGVTKKFTTHVIIESQDKIEMKSMLNKRLVFMYYYTPVGYFNKVDVQGIDVINLSFALIDNNTHKLNLSGIQNKVDEVIKFHSYGVRVVLSIGGWGADGFSQACATEETRQIFVNSIMDAVKKYHFDGVDLDWEYPTSRSAGIASSSSDKVNFTALCTLLRQELDAYKDGMLLTAAVSGSSTNYYEVKKLDPLLDYWHIMTYEYNNNSKSSYDSSFSQTKTGIDKWISAGATNTKVVLGVTFYASLYKIESSAGNPPGYGQNAIGGAQHVSLKSIWKDIHDTTKYRGGTDTTNGMGYVLSTSRDSNGYLTFISYDTPQSYQKKVEFIKTANLAGVMSWEFGEDTAERNQMQLLLNALARYGN